MLEAALPLRIAVIASGSAPGIEALLDDENRGRIYELVAVIGTETTLAEAARIEAAGVPVILRPIRSFHEERALPLRNLRARGEFDAELTDLLQRLDADYVFLCNYHYLVTEPLLAAFPNRVIAIHDGDLSARDEDGSRRFAGTHAVQDAVFAGANETRSSAFIVNRTVGGGPLFLLSAPFPVATLARDARKLGAIDLLTEYAALHRRWMLQAAWGPMLRRAAELLAGGYVQVVKDVVWVDGAPGPCRSGESPSMCHEHEHEIARGIPASCPFISNYERD